jgi:hypothetical protein
MDEDAIENMAAEQFDNVCEAVDDWSIKDQIDYFETIESDVGLRIRGLKEDLARES